MRRLVVLVATIVLVDTIFYAALAPMLPTLADDFDLSKGQSGFLVASYAAGTLIGSLPAGWAVSRVGARRVLVGGLLVMTVAGLLFAFADSLALLDGARFVQGLGGACSWTAGLACLAQQAPPERRGAVIGTAIGAGIFGAQLGPVLGGVAEAIGRAPAFAAMSVLGLVLAVWATTAPAAPAVAERRATLGTALRDPRFRSSLWVTLLPATCFGIVEVLVPLRLDHLGAGATAIAAAFFVAALVEAAVSPLTGRWADRHGMRGILRTGLLGGALLLVVVTLPQNALVLAVVLVVLGAALGMLWTPGGNLISLAADRLGLDQGLAFGLNNIQWAGGIAIGSAMAGVLGETVGDWVPYALAAALCLLTGVIWWSGGPAADATGGNGPTRSLPSSR